MRPFIFYYSQSTDNIRNAEFSKNIVFTRRVFSLVLKLLSLDVAKGAMLWCGHSAVSPSQDPEPSDLGITRHLMTRNYHWSSLLWHFCLTFLVLAQGHLGRS